MARLLDRCRAFAKTSRAYLARQFRPRTRTDWIVLAGAIAVEAWLWWKSGPPGAAIGALGAVAAIMTFSRPTPLQRLLVIILAVSLYALEMHLISEDRAAQQSAAERNFAKIQADNRDKTDAVLKDNRDKTVAIISDARNRFDVTVSKFRDISTLSNKNLLASNKTLDNITGARSFPYIVPVNQWDGTKFQVVVENDGGSVLTGVDIAVDHYSGPGYVILDRGQYNIGTIPPRGEVRLDSAIVPMIDKANHIMVSSFDFTIKYQGGIVLEEIIFKPHIGKLPWCWQYTAKTESILPSRKGLPFVPSKELLHSPTLGCDS